MKKIVSLLGLLLLTAALVLPCAAEEASVTEIWTVEDLQAIAANPAGSYILMNDLDMTDVAWSCPSFSGVLDGNGHALMNLKLTAFAETQVQTLDGSNAEYATDVAGLFGSMEGAEIKNLKLLGIYGVLKSDQPAYVGTIAGSAIDSRITDCEIIGRLELRGTSGIIGMGGAVGYGSGWVENCRIDVTLVSVDTDSTLRDEQYLGGVFGSGFFDCIGNDIYLLACVSEHGGVHSGGIGGLLKQSPLGMARVGRIRDNCVEGTLRYFASSKGERAYVGGQCAEVQAWNKEIYRNIGDNFHMEESKDYETELRPDPCGSPLYTRTEVAGSCEEYGCLISVCDSCGYSYQSDFTPRVHQVTSWTVVKEPEIGSWGRSTGTCELCGETLVSLIEPLPEPVEETEPETEPVTETEPITEETLPVAQVQETKRDTSVYIAWTFVGLTAVIAVFLAVFLIGYIKHPEE